MSDARRVVVTGLGAVTPIGQDVPAFLAAMRAGTVGIGPIRNIPTERLSVRIAAEVAGFDPAAHFPPRQLAFLDRATQLALVAAREAVRDAGYVPASAHGVILGGTHGYQTTDDAYHQLYGEGATRLHPFTVPRIMPNAAASHISIAFGMRGPCFTVASACASATHAIGVAFGMVRSGAVDAMLTGGADASIVVGVLKGWEGLRVLSPDGCRPFSRDRNGMAMGEGAGILLLESLDHARARGATIHAEIAGFGMGADGADITAPDAGGAAAAMRAALADAGCAPEEVGYVNAHGTGTRLNDRTESAALHDVFAGRPPPVSSTKSMIGHCMTAGGALEMIATVSALRDGLLPPTAGFAAPDPDCPVDPVPGLARPATIDAAMSNSFAFGGLNAVLVARRMAG